MSSGLGLDAEGEIFVADVHCDQRIYLEDPKPYRPRRKSRRGRKPTRLEARLKSIRAAIDLCEAILAKDNCREEIYRRLMVCHYCLGQRDKALRQFKTCIEVLKAELEADAMRATVRLYEQIKQNTSRSKPKQENF